MRHLEVYRRMNRDGLAFARYAAYPKTRRMPPDDQVSHSLEPILCFTPAPCKLRAGEATVHRGRRSARKERGEPLTVTPVERPRT